MSALPKESDWFVHHPEISTRYAGEYIAIVGESVVAHGKDFKVVLSEGKKHGRPYIHKVRKADQDLVI